MKLYTDFPLGLNVDTLLPSSVRLKAHARNVDAASEKELASLLAATTGR